MRLRFWRKRKAEPEPPKIVVRESTLWVLDGETWKRVPGVVPGKVVLKVPPGVELNQ